MKICAYKSGDLVVANKIELRSSSPGLQVMLQGVVDTSAPPKFKVLGVTVDTSGLAESAFLDINNTPVGSTKFFSLVTDGTTVVRSKGVYTSTTRTIKPDQVEIEWM